MKIRCNNCYRVLNQNEEYCTSCGEYSPKMHNAMITGNYGPDNSAKFKLAFGVFGIAGFIICGVLQVIFAVIQTRELEFTTQEFCQTNSLFYSGLLALIIMLIVFRKDLKEFIKLEKKNLLFSIIIGILVITIVILLSKLFTFTQIFPNFIVEYLSNNPVFLDLKNECIIKIAVGSVTMGITLEFVRKYLIDAFDDTMLSDKSILIFSTIIMTICEVAWIMSLDVAIVVLIINITFNLLYMQTNRSIILNISLRTLLYIITFLIL